jgi:hypothetical protein
MKCALNSEMVIVEFDNSQTPPKRLAPLELVALCERRGKLLYAPAGTIIDDPRCFELVLNGDATAADDECRAMDTRNAEQVEATRKARKRLADGIHPEDFVAYEAGEMLGYDKDGKPIPGPNAKPKTTDEEEE